MWNKGYAFIIIIIIFMIWIYEKTFFWILVFIGLAWILYRMLRQEPYTQYGYKGGREFELSYTPEPTRRRKIEKRRSKRQYFDEHSHSDWENMPTPIKDQIYEKNGYLFNGHHRPIHREVAERELWNKGLYDKRFTKPFSEYQVHHKDGNKKNNSPENLEIVSKKEHRKRHYMFDN